jgi:hypothetical protein
MTWLAGGPTTQPVAKGSSGGGASTADESLPGIETTSCFHVAKTSNGGEDGSVRYPYTTIQAAVTKAATLTPTATAPITILVHPGTYDETVSVGADFIHVVGLDRFTCILFSDSGVPLAMSQTGTVQRMTIQSDGGQKIASFSGDVEAVDCNFIGDDSDAEVVEVTGSLVAEKCVFQKSDDSTEVIETGAAATDLTLMYGDCYGSLDLNGGNITIKGFTITSDDAVGAINVEDSVGSLVITDCKITNTVGNAIYSIIDYDLSVWNSQLAGTTHDIHGSVTVTDASIGNVEMAVGMSGYIRKDVPVNFVGPDGHTDWHTTLQDAIDATESSLPYHCILRDDITVSSPITFPNYEVVVDGQNQFSISAANEATNVMEFDDDELVYIYALGILGVIDVTDGELHMSQCVITGTIEVNGGDASTLVELRETRIEPSSNSYAIVLADADPTVICKSSRLKGSTGNPAVYWDTITNDNFKTSYSVILHGDLGANNPFGRSGAQTPTYYSHHNGYNTKPDTGGTWVNGVTAAQQHETEDAGVDF